MTTAGNQNFTINLGLRYEFLTMPTEVNGKIALLHRYTDPVVTVGGPVHDRNPTQLETLLHVSDSFGILSSDGKSSIRAGFGIFDSLPLLVALRHAIDTLGSFLRSGHEPQPLRSVPFRAAPFRCLQITDLRTAYVDPDPGRSYSMKWNLNLQQEIQGWVVELGLYRVAWHSPAVG